jgi:hypothetical protein
MTAKQYRALGEQSGNGDSIAELQAVFKDYGYMFRHFSDATVAYMRWQAGRIRADIV